MPVITTHLVSAALLVSSTVTLARVATPHDADAGSAVPVALSAVPVVLSAVPVVLSAVPVVLSAVPVVLSAVSGELPDTLALEVAFDGAPRRIALSAFAVRSSDYVLRRRLPGGSFEDVEPAPCATYRGFVEGWPGALVGATLADGGVRLVVVGAPDGSVWTADAAADVSGRPLAARRAAPEELAFTCPVEGPADVGPGPGPGVGVGPGNGGQAAATVAAPGVRVAELAFDVDSTYVAQVGGEAAVQAAVDFLALRASLYYEYDFGVVYSVSGLVVPASPAADPYLGLTFSCFCGNWNGLNCAGTASRVLLNEWQWQTSPHTDIQRDVVHLLAGNGVAADATGCALWRVCNGALGWSTGVDLQGTARTRVLIHELGHNWGACHCNQSSCAAYSPDDCGFMVSNGGGGSFFGQTTRAALANIAASACLDDGTSSASAPQLVSVTPASVPILGGTVVLQGSGFDEVLFIDWAGTLFDAGFVRDDQRIELPAPPGAAFGPHVVTVIGPGGTSSLAFDYAECLVPELTTDRVWIDYVWPFFPGTVTWSYCGPVGLEVKLLVSRTAATRTVDGFEVLAHASTLEAGPMTGVGLRTRSLVFTGAGVYGIDFRVQVIAVDAAGRVVGASQVVCQYIGSGCNPNPCGLNDDC